MNLEKLIDLFEGNFENMDLNLSVDCVIFTIQDGRLKVLLTKLFSESNWMLPGGFINKNEEVDAAARRALNQRTGVENIFLQQFQVFSKPDRFSFEELFQLLQKIDRDINGIKSFPKRVISIGYFALVNYEKVNLTGGVFEEEVTWIDLKSLPKLFFDHNEIVKQAVESLRKELYFSPIAYNLLPAKFTMPELQKLYEIILDKFIDRSSFQKKMLKWDIYERLEERKEGVAHKRPFLYQFDQEKYTEALSKGIKFGI